MVFNKKLREIAIKLYTTNTMTYAYDSLTASLAYVYGGVYIDEKSYMLHRRHNNSITTGGRGFINRLKMEYKIVFVWKDYFLGSAYFMLNFSKQFDMPIKDEINDFLQTIINYKKSLKCKFKLLFNKKMKSGSKIADLETRFRIIINNY